MTIIIIIDLLATRQILFFDNTWQAIIFILTIVIAYGFGSLILLRYTRKASTELRAKNPFINTMHLAVTIIQFSLLGILLFIIYGNSISCPDYFSFCMVSRSLATSINAIASASAGIILGVISFKFFSWYKLNNKNFMVLFYGLAAATLAMSITVDAGDKILLQQVVEEKSPATGIIPQSSFIYKTTEKYHGQVQYKVVNPQTTTQYVVPDSMKALHKFLVYLVSDTPYVFTWAGTLMLLRQYYLSNKGGGKFPIKYWVLLSVPLVLYIIGSGLIISLPSEEPYRYYFRIIFRAGTIGSSVLFGLAFFVITRDVKTRIEKNVVAEKVKDYLSLSAIGIVIVGIANEVSALQQTYGAAGHGLVLISSFLFSIGLYYSAISISQDSSLRNSIRKSAIDLLQDIGTAQLQQEALRRIRKLVQDNQQKLEEETGISSSLTEDDVKEYLEQVTKEVKKKS
jgi:hypothetical protein